MASYVLVCRLFGLRMSSDQLGRVREDTRSVTRVLRTSVIAVLV